VGLGHLRRNLAIAGEITTVFPNAYVMIVTASPCATQFELPENTDLIKIPSITKNEMGQYVTRSFAGSLETTLKFRSKIILETFHSFEPNLIIIDHQLTGLKGEALDMLREAKMKNILVFYGMRDVLDSPEVVENSWNTVDSRWALNECYDQICIYGMQEVFDPCKAYAPLLDRIDRCNFTGYIVPPVRKVSRRRLPGAKKKVLVTFGGGSDGANRAEKYLQALATAPAHWDSHVITGPLMEPDIIRRLITRAKTIQPLGSVKVKRFHRNLPGLLRQVDAVVSMAGYNGCAEILQSGLPAVLLPRSFPRKEQLIRASRLAELGWVRTLPEHDPKPEELFSAVDEMLASPHRIRPEANLNGLQNLCTIILEHLEATGLVDDMPLPGAVLGGQVCA
jgi:predicted glycosyltransferase